MARPDVENYRAKIVKSQELLDYFISKLKEKNDDGYKYNQTLTTTDGTTFDVYGTTKKGVFDSRFDFIPNEKIRNNKKATNNNTEDIQVEKMMSENKKVISEGVFKIGNKYFGTQRSGFIHDKNSKFVTMSMEQNLEDMQDLNEDEDSPLILDSTFAFPLVFNKDTKKVEEFPKYTPFTKEDVTIDEYNEWKSQNKNKFLIIYDTENIIGIK